MTIQTGKIADPASPLCGMCGSVIQLVYTIFTPGSDEALDPVLLALATALLFQLGSDESFHWQDGFAVLLRGAALSMLLAVRILIAPDEGRPPKLWWWFPRYPHKPALDPRLLRLPRFLKRSRGPRFDTAESPPLCTISRKSELSPNPPGTQQQSHLPGWLPHRGPTPVRIPRHRIIAPYEV